MILREKKSDIWRETVFYNKKYYAHLFQLLDLYSNQEIYWENHTSLIDQCSINELHSTLFQMISDAL